MDIDPRLAIDDVMEKNTVFDGALWRTTSVVYKDTTTVLEFSIKVASVTMYLGSVHLKSVGGAKSVRNSCEPPLNTMRNLHELPPTKSQHKLCKDVDQMLFILRVLTRVSFV